MNELKLEVSSTIVMAAKGVSKRYPGVQALQDVSIDLRAGEVHALLGENGAGKSTMMRLLGGVEAPDAGDILMEGSRVKLRSPRDAFLRGVRSVPQERSLVPTFSVAENVMLDHLIFGRIRVVSQANLNRRSQEFLDMVGLHIPPTTMTSDLGAGQQQLVEIARALATGGSILLLDEPTASISRREVDSLIVTIRHLKQQGLAVLFISHKLDEVEEVCDVVTVLRDGRNVEGGSELRTFDTAKLIRLMIGREALLEPLKPATTNRSTKLSVDNARNFPTGMVSSFEVKKGEIVGWYGLVGSGRTELAKTILTGNSGGSTVVRLDGEVIKIRSLFQALNRFGIGYVSEDRQHEGVFLDHSIARNVSVTVWRKHRTRLGLLSVRREREEGRRSIFDLGIKAASENVVVRTLSGGNKQKVSIAKWLLAGADVLFVDEPTVGIDVGTKDEIHGLLRTLADEGCSIVLISSDMPELVRLAARVYVFREGAIVGERDNSYDLTEMSEWIMNRIVGEIE